MHFRTAREMHVPIDWTTFTQKAAVDAERASAAQMLGEALPDDFEALRALAILQLGIISDLEDRLASVTFAARLNADTIEAQRAVMKEMEKKRG